MNKGELIDKIAKDAKISKVQASNALNSALDGIVSTLKKGSKVTLVGFGTFSVSSRKARTGRNPQTGAPLNVLNSDQTTHNIHPTPVNNREWNQSQPPGAADIENSFARPEVMIPVKCNVHPWMIAYVGVLPHPFFSVTGADGSFEIKGLPPGNYVIEAWHEKYGTFTQNVTVGASESKEVEFTISG